MKKESHKIKKPWATKAAMEQIYEKSLWGNHTADFYSGNGSHNPEIVTPYIEIVTSFLTSFKKPIKVCDLGCGDFNVGKELVKYSEKYYAVDIVENLIAHNREKFKATNLEFYCLDISKDKLPSADCAIIRQVLQHISNREVLNIVNKLSAFKYVILTEHLPKENFIPNKDIISGQGIRLKKQSGINLLKPPFNFKVKEEKELISYNLKDGKGVIKTVLYVL